MEAHYLKISASFHNTPFTAFVKLAKDKSLDQNETAQLICNELKTNSVSEISSTTTESTEAEYNAFKGKKYDLTEEKTSFDTAVLELEEEGGV
jgi:hypothetical protein